MKNVKFILSNAKFIILNATLLVFNAKLLIFNTKFIIYRTILPCCPVVPYQIHFEHKTIPNSI